MRLQRTDDKSVSNCYVVECIGLILMSKEQFAAFVEAVKSDEALKAKLAEAADFASICAIAETTGCKISEEDLQSYEPSEDLSDDELEATAGGFGGFGGAFLPPGLDALKAAVPGLDPEKLAINLNGDINLTFNNDININL